jgi:polysaccharide biosynthesis protein PslJ
MSHAAPLASPPRRLLPLGIVGAGLVVLVATIPLGPKAAVGGSVVMVLATGIALLESRAPFVTWPNALAALFGVFWLIPMKIYGLPVNLPFALEPYRLFLLVLLVAWIGALVLGRTGVSAAGHAGPIALLFFVALGSLVLNYRELADLGGSETEAVKPLTFFMAFLLVYMLVASTIRDIVSVERLVRVLVAGGTIVALAAIYEAATRYNVFDHLDRLLPFLVKHEREIDAVRGGRLRVRSSAQHPIALSVALTAMVPLALYLAGRARSPWRSRGWMAATIVLATGAFTTVSRTMVVMGIVMLVVWLVLRRRQIQRFWPLLVLLPFVVHFAAPGAIGGIWKAFFPEEGLITSLGGRAGEGGSGRFADYGAARTLWEESPVLGSGPGSYSLVPVEAARRIEQGLQAVTNAPNLIFDNQYLTSLVEFGVVGVIALLWLTFGAAFKLARYSLRHRTPVGDLAAVCAVSCAGFGASMFLFDALAFIQATLVFFVVAALGLRATMLASSPGRLPPPAVGPAGAA